MSDHEAWRAALIAYCEKDELRERAAGLRRGEPMDYIDHRMIDALKAALDALKAALAAQMVAA